jgi:hypothetical protein
VKGEREQGEIEEYLLSLIDLSSELALRRNKKAYHYLRHLYSMEAIMTIISMGQMPLSFRSRLLKLLLTLYMDREPL